MWQNLLCHCVVFTKASEEFAPYYLAEIRHDIRQTTVRQVKQCLSVRRPRENSPQSGLAILCVNSGRLGERKSVPHYLADYGILSVKSQFLLLSWVHVYFW